MDGVGEDFVDGSPDVVEREYRQVQMESCSGSEVDDEDCVDGDVRSSCSQGSCLGNMASMDHAEFEMLMGSGGMEDASHESGNVMNGTGNVLEMPEAIDKSEDVIVDVCDDDEVSVSSSVRVEDLKANVNDHTVSSEGDDLEDTDCLLYTSDAADE